MEAGEKTYYQLNSGAHRKTSLRVQAPALTCHMGFWIPDPPGGTRPDEARERWKLGVDRSILGVIAELRASSPDAHPVECNSTVGHRLVLMASVHHFDTLEPQSDADVDYRVKDVKQSDYRIVHVSGFHHGYKLSFSYELHTEYLSLTMVLQPHRSEAGKAARQADDPLGLTRALDETARHLKDGDDADIGRAAEAIYHAIWDGIIASHLPAGGAEFGDIFADFRGLIISDETRTFRDQTFWNDGTRAWPQWGDSAVTSLQQIVSDRPGQEVKVSYEITASYMLSGRALYLTNLGPQVPDLDSAERIPTKYVIYVHQRDLSQYTIGIVNKWQLGRLIDRLHWLGIHRLAALRDLPALREASGVLAGLHDVDKETRRAGEDSRNRVLYERYRSQLERIPLGIHNGLQYRVERSRYYVSNFKRVVSSLRLIRVEGYQPYDQFIEHRLGSTFSFIDRLGIRYERALNAMSRVRANATMDELVVIQELGEQVLIMGLAPYYVSHLLNTIGFFLDFEEAGTLATWTAFVIGYLVWKRPKPKPPLRKRVAQTAVAAVVSAAAYLAIVQGLRHSGIDVERVEAALRPVLTPFDRSPEAKPRGD